MNISLNMARDFTDVIKNLEMGIPEWARYNCKGPVSEKGISENESGIRERDLKMQCC